MKTHDDGHDDIEWEAQERAMRDIHGTSPEGISPLDASYRKIAEALIDPPTIELPADFASRIARHEFSRSERFARTVEGRIALVLGTLLGAGVAWALAQYGATLYGLLQSSRGTWLIGLGLCLVATAMTGPWFSRRHVTRG